MAMSGWRELTPSIIALCDELPRDRALRLGQSDGRRADCASCAMGCPPRPTASPQSITRPGPMPRRGCGWTTTSARTSRWAWRPQSVRQGLCPDRQLPRTGAELLRQPAGTVLRRHFQKLSAPQRRIRRTGAVEPRAAIRQGLSCSYDSHVGAHCQLRCVFKLHVSTSGRFETYPERITSFSRGTVAAIAMRCRFPSKGSQVAAGKPNCTIFAVALSGKPERRGTAPRLRSSGSAFIEEG